MIYLSWAVLYEGASDQAYFDVLLPRVMESLVMLDGKNAATVPESPALKFKRGTIDEVAKEACEASDAFHLIFIHSDTGGRGLRSTLATRSIAYCQAIGLLCGFSGKRCVTISPRHETEAWTLADPQAVLSALGYRGDAAAIGLPTNAIEAEALVDPKQVLNDAIKIVRGRRNAPEVKQIYPAIAQRQSLSVLRRSASFVEFETRLHAALYDLGCVK